MGNKQELNCGLEGQPGFCPIAKAGNGCRQLIECFDANLTPGETTPADFVQRFPLEMTVDQAALLRTQKVKANPLNKTPLTTMITAIENPDPEEITPEEFVNRLHVEGLTAEKAALLRAQHIMNNPANPTPLAGSIYSLSKLEESSSNYLEPMLAKVLNGGKAPDNLFDPQREKVVFELKPKPKIKNEGISPNPFL